MVAGRSTAHIPEDPRVCEPNWISQKQNEARPSNQQTMMLGTTIGGMSLARVAMHRTSAGIAGHRPSLFSILPRGGGAVGSAAAQGCCFVHIERRLADLQIVLPPPPTPKANYNLICKTGQLLFVSGHLPLLPDGFLLTGRIGREEAGGESIEAGYAAARHCGLNIISTLQDQLGDLDRIKQIVKLFGIVQSTPDFHEQHRVMDGCSDLMIQIFGHKVGYHARSAIGTSNLPLNMRVEVEAVVELHA